MLHTDLLVATDNKGMFDGMPQFTDIARPRGDCQNSQGFTAHATDPTTEMRIELDDKVV